MFITTTTSKLTKTPGCQKEIMAAYEGRDFLRAYHFGKKVTLRWEADPLKTMHQHFSHLVDFYRSLRESDFKRCDKYVNYVQITDMEGNPGHFPLGILLNSRPEGYLGRPSSIAIWAPYGDTIMADLYSRGDSGQKDFFFGCSQDLSEPVSKLIEQTSISHPPKELVQETLAEKIYVFK